MNKMFLHPGGCAFEWIKARHGRRLMVVVATLLLVLQSCSDSEGQAQVVEPQKPTQFAVTLTAAADFSSGAHSVIEVESPHQARNSLVPTISDLSAASQGRFFYRIERFSRDNVTKFDINSPDQVVYQYSSKDPLDTVSSNPTAMVFVDDSKAYLLRYGSSKAWIVNPSASSETDFKIGELDLSAYDQGDGIPEMQDAVIVGDRLFIVMQRLTLFQPTKTGYVAVFDVVADSEIDTGMGDADGLKGIPLSVRNPLSIHYLADNNLIYVQAVGKFAFGSEPAQLTGGIEALDPENFTTKLVLDDGDDAAPAAFGQILDMALVSANQGYIIGTKGFQDNSLYRFDPGTGEIVSDVNGPQAVGGLFGQNLTSIAVDANHKLWVSVADFTAPGMTIIDTANDSVDVALIGTVLNPGKTVFCETN